MTTLDADEPGRTLPIEVPPSEPTSPPVEPAPAAAAPEFAEVAAPVTAASVAEAPPEPAVTYVPLAITIGDGFKFGCGFFLAGTVALLVAFVLLAALFLLTTLFGLNLPISR